VAEDPVTVDPVMRRLYTQALRVAAGKISMLIVGETGVGKDHLAEYLHVHSGRGGHPLVRLNCAAISPNLFESELFGHERGAFTGADRAKPGWFELAGEGTIFLDEIGEMPLALQAKLLRALESRAASRVGGTELRPILARFIAATNCDLDRAVEARTFRRDLYHRIAGIRLEIPPLRQRTSEILPVAESFVQAISAEMGIEAPELSADARLALLSHSWPGNIRELRNVIERALLFAEGAIQADDLQLPSAGAGSQPFTRVLDVVRLGPESGDPSGAPTMLRPSPRAGTGEGGWTREDILRALELCGGNQKLAAANLGIARRTFCRWLDRFGIRRPRKRTSELPATE
jgi:transcriptional regulator with PAS, ATPase and Fis domain